MGHAQKNGEWKQKRSDMQKKTGIKPDGQKKSSRAWVELYGIKVIFIQNDVIVEISFFPCMRKHLISSTHQQSQKPSWQLDVGHFWGKVGM